MFSSIKVITNTNLEGGTTIAYHYEDYQNLTTRVDKEKLNQNIKKKNYYTYKPIGGGTTIAYH